MTHIEKMKQWLKALEYIDDGANNQGAHTGISWRCVSNKAQPAITSLRQAIAEAEGQEKALQALHTENERLGLYEDAYAEQEPVAWKETHGKVIKALAGIVNVHTPDKLFDLDAIPRESVMGLVQQIKVAIDAYQPQRTEQEPVIDKSAAVRIATALGWEPKREWVGLTDEEIQAVLDKPEPFYDTMFWFARTIERKLKEKNA